MVPGNGLEPLHLSAQASETCVSTNSTTRAGKGGQRHPSPASQASPDFAPPFLRSLRRPQSLNAAMSARAVCISAKMMSVCPSNCRPAGVIVTMRPIRSNKRQPKSRSKALIAWLTADCVSPISLAACVKLPTRANVAKARSLRLSKMEGDMRGGRKRMSLS
jgi:hypothetical protein